MEDQEVMVGVRDFGCVTSSNEKAAQQVSSDKESENLSVNLLEDLDSYWDDINDRLTISRMVSDSVIKGMVKAVEQAAEEKIASKELQVNNFKEAIMDVQSKINDLTRKYVDENENRVSLELKALQREEELRFVIEEKKRLEQEVHLLVGSLEEKEKVRVELSAALVKEKEQFQLASQKVNNLEDQTSLLQILVTERSMEVKSIKGELALMLKQIEVDKGKIKKLDQNVELRTKELREADEHRNMLLAITEDNQNHILLLEAKEDDQRKQMRSVIVLVHELLRGLSELECQVAERARNNNLRLEESSSELSSLKNTTLLYRKRLQRRCNDLQMAESEVDLLGDEVDALLSLLEKVYIALDHYSPIFQHYPGVMEILKLVRKELSKESSNSN